MNCGGVGGWTTVQNDHTPNMAALAIMRPGELSAGEWRLLFWRGAMLAPWFLVVPVGVARNPAEPAMLLLCSGVWLLALATKLTHWPSAMDHATLAAIARGEARRYPWLLFGAGVLCLLVVIAVKALK